MSENMSAQFQQVQKQEQNLSLTPQLKRSLEILQVTSLDLQKLVEKELLSNPLLKDVTPKQDNVNEVINKQKDDFTSYNYENQHSNYSDEAQKKRDHFFDSLTDSQSLQEYLLKDIIIDARNDDVAKAFTSLVGCLDDRGFLETETLDILKNEGFDDETIDEALSLLRKSPPAGIGAFDVRDSLILQLEHKSMSNSLAYKILDQYHELLAEQKIVEIASRLNRTPEDIEEAIDKIKELHLNPAAEFLPDPIFIKESLIFKKNSDGVWFVTLDEKDAPKLQIDKEYEEILNNKNLKKEDKSYIKEKARSAKQFIESLQERQKTILRIGEVILSKQYKYFEKGDDALKPMTMQEIADILELNASTISRAVSGKYARIYINTKSKADNSKMTKLYKESKIVPLKDFFSSGYESGSGENLSNATVKNKIKIIVSDESPKSPLSDAKIAKILEDDGITIARRTVAKYREELGIPTKTLRKRI